jgi:hypothetical protein
MTGPLMLRLASRCPSCERIEPRRLFPWERDRWVEENPERPIERVQCDRCGTRYIVYAKHYQRAEPAP